jgi:GTP-binding protein
VLVHLVEPLPMDGTDPVTNYEAIRDELRQYNVTLAERPEAVVVTKGELPGAADVRQRLEERLGRPVLMISAVTGQGLPALVQAVARLLGKWPQAD